MTSKLLWTNSSPTSDFAAQTVSGTFSGYDFYDLVIATADNPNYHAIYRIYPGILTSIYGAHYKGYNRKFTINDSSMVVTAGSQRTTGSWETANDVLKPIKVYGIKVVS